jgi:hypothetical protein
LLKALYKSTAPQGKLGNLWFLMFPYSRATRRSI